MMMVMMMMMMMMMTVLPVHAGSEDLLFDECIVRVGKKEFFTYFDTILIHLENNEDVRKLQIMVNDGTNVKNLPSHDVDNGVSSWVKGYIVGLGSSPEFTKDPPSQPRRTGKRTKIEIDTRDLKTTRYIIGCLQDMPNYELTSNMSNEYLIIPKLDSAFDGLRVFTGLSSSFIISGDGGADETVLCKERSHGCTFIDRNEVTMFLTYIGTSVDISVKGQDIRLQRDKNVRFSKLESKEDKVYIVQCNGPCSASSSGNSATASVATSESTTTATAHKPEDQAEVSRELVDYLIMGTLAAITVVQSVALLCCCYRKRKKEASGVASFTCNSCQHNATAMTLSPGDHHSNNASHHNPVHAEDSHTYEELNDFRVTVPGQTNAGANSFSEVNDIYQPFEKTPQQQSTQQTKTSYDEVNDIYQPFDQPTEQQDHTSSTSYDEVNDIYQPFDQTKPLHPAK